MNRIRLLLVLMLVLQLVWQGASVRDGARAQALGQPPSLASLRLASLGESAMMSRYLMLYLQSFDAEPGVAAAYHDLDYAALVKWLKASLVLDGRDPYPLFAAGYIYSSAAGADKKTAVLDFIYSAFSENPEKRWPWLARGYLIAKYELHEPALAGKYAHALNMHAKVPNWVGEMTAFTLDDMGELEREKILLGGMLAGGRISDENEIAFLKRELERIENR